MNGTKVLEARQQVISQIRSEATKDLIDKTAADSAFHSAMGALIDVCVGVGFDAGVKFAEQEFALNSAAPKP